MDLFPTLKKRDRNISYTKTSVRLFLSFPYKNILKL